MTQPIYESPKFRVGLAFQASFIVEATASPRACLAARWSPKVVLGRITFLVRPRIIFSKSYVALPSVSEFEMPTILENFAGNTPPPTVGLLRLVFGVAQNFLELFEYFLWRTIFEAPHVSVPLRPLVIAFDQDLNASNLSASTFPSPICSYSVLATAGILTSLSVSAFSLAIRSSSAFSSAQIWTNLAVMDIIM